MSSLNLIINAVNIVNGICTFPTNHEECEKNNDGKLSVVFHGSFKGVREVICDQPMMFVQGLNVLVGIHNVLCRCAVL